MSTGVGSVVSKGNLDRAVWHSWRGNPAWSVFQKEERKGDKDSCLDNPFKEICCEGQGREEK